MKYIGAGLLWISFLLTGLNLSERYEQRYIIFEELLLMVEELSNGIFYLSLPLDEILVVINNRGSCKKLTFIALFNEFIDCGSDFPDAWKKSVYSCSLPLKREEKEKIISFGLSLGRSDSENQRSLLKLYSAQFNTYANEAYNLKKKYSLTSAFMGFLCGGAVFILLI